MLIKYGKNRTYIWAVPTIDSDNCFAKVCYKGKPELYRMNIPYRLLLVNHTLQLVTTSNNKKDVFHFNIYPNSAHSEIQLIHTLKTAGIVSMYLFDNSGNVITNLENLWK